MAELYDDWLSGPMTRAEALELSPDDKEERKRLRRKIFDKQSYERNKIDIKKSFLKVLESVEELGSDVQDILPLIEEVDDLEKKEKEED